jgi:hypothetical protein
MRENGPLRGASPCSWIGQGENILRLAGCELLESEQKAMFCSDSGGFQLSIAQDKKRPTTMAGLFCEVFNKPYSPSL